jgi:hypothetical protein
MGCGEYQGNAILDIVATSPLHPAAPASGVAVVKTASLVAVRRWSPTPPATVPDQRAGDPRIR